MTSFILPSAIYLKMMKLEDNPRQYQQAQVIYYLGFLIMFLVVIDSQCYSYQDTCLPDLGSVITAPTVTSDQSLLLGGFAHGQINKEWKEKIGAVYTILASKTITGNYHTFSIISISYA